MFDPLLNNLLLAQQEICFDELKKFFRFFLAENFLHFNQYSSLFSYLSGVWLRNSEERLILNQHFRFFLLHLHLAIIFSLLNFFLFLFNLYWLFVLG